MQFRSTFTRSNGPHRKVGRQTVRGAGTPRAGGMHPQPAGPGESPGEGVRRFFAPVTVVWAAGELAGFTESFSAMTVRIQSLQGLPALDDPCEIHLHPIGGDVSARGVVVSADAARSQCEIALEQFSGNGEYLLRLLMSRTPFDGRAGY